ncbi:MAG: DMT family transporter [Spirochaetales bacterium]|nr:DMT family transporter [Spirochaetales bacterium]
MTQCKSELRYKMNNKTKAILLMLLSSLSFAIMAFFVKLSGDIPLFQKVFFRDLVVVIFTLCGLASIKVSPWGKKENRLQLWSRGISGFIGVAFYFYSASHLYLSDSTIINKLSPFFTTLFAVLLLKEKIKPLQIFALVLSLFDGILVVKPEFSMSVFPAFCGIIGAIVAGFSYAMVISLTNREEPLVVVFYFSNTSVLCSFFLMLANFQIPTLQNLIILICTGIFATGGQVLLTYAYKYAKASSISVYSYSIIIFSGLLGFIFWKEIPDFRSVIGGLFIIISGFALYIAQYLQKKNR